MSSKDFPEQMRSSGETAREGMVIGAERVYEEAERLYGDSRAGLKAWYMEGGYEEQRPASENREKQRRVW